MQWYIRKKMSPKLDALRLVRLDKIWFHGALRLVANNQILCLRSNAMVYKKENEPNWTLLGREKPN